MPSTHPHGALARLLAPVLAVAGLLAAAPSALAIPSSLPDPTWMADGPVYAVAPTTAGTTYIGGNFHYVGPRTGGGAVLDRDTVGSPPMTGWREVVGKVYAVVPDGVGGFYIGGSFTKVGGLAIKNLAHILPDRSVASQFHPNPNSTVRALALQSGSHRWLYVGGDFTSFTPTTGLTTRNRLAEIDTQTGAPSSWNPNVNHTVRALALSPTDTNRVFVGGDFDTIGPDTRVSLAAVDIDHTVGHAAYSRATTWNPLTNGNVNALVVNAAGDTVYAAGTFTCVNGTDSQCNAGVGRNYVAALDASTATNNAQAYNALIPKTTGYHVDALALSDDGSTLYAGGNFSDDLIATDPISGTHTSWDPNPGGPVESLAVTGSTIYAGGAFSDIGGQQRGRIAALRALDASAIETWNPGTNDPSGTSAVYALAVSDNPNDGSHEVYAGGDFTSTGGVPRDNLAAIDVNGVPTAWSAGAGADSTVQAMALSADEGTLYVGGVFTSLANTSRSKLGALTTGTTATLLPWNPDVDPSGTVSALVLDGPDVYAGGSFTAIGGVTHNRIAAVDATTGVVRAGFAASVDDVVYSLSVGRGTVYAGGLFLHAGLSNGTTRQRLAAFAETDGSLLSWNPAPDGTVRALAFSLGTSASSDLLYVGGDFTTAGGLPRARIAAISPTDGTATAWNPGADASVYAIAVAGPRIYLGGDFQSFTGTPSNQPKRLAAVATDSGASIGWTPNPDGTVNVLAVRSSTLYAGGSYKNVVTNTSANSVTQQNYGTFTTIPTNTTIPSIAGTLAVGQTLTCDKGLWTGMVASTTYTYEWRTTTGPIAGQTATTYTVGNDDGGAAISCRVTATNTDGATTAESLAVSIPGPPANTSVPQISGTTVAGGTGTVLACSQGSWTGTVSIYSTAWKRDGLAIDTGTTHSVVSADLNHVLTCAVTASGPGGSRTIASGNRTVPSIPQVSSLPTLSGTTTVGAYVTCGPGAWNGSPSYTYTWLRGGLVVGGSAQYQIAAADAQQQLRCRVTATNESGQSQADSALVSVVALPINAVAPAIAGEARVGRQLACSPGTWTGSTTFTYAYQWLRDGLPIAGAAGTSYTNGAADGGHAISCRVTAANAAGSQSVGSAAVGVPAVPGATSAPQISGAANVGSTLTCSLGTWVNAASLAVEWRRNGTAIPGATGNSYKLTSADSGAMVSCRVTATNGAETATSDATALFVNSTNGGAGGTGGTGGTGGAGTATGPKPSVTTAAVKVVSGTGKLGLGCAKGAACAGTATLTSGKVKLATVRFALAAGSKKQLTFHLTAAGKQLLKKKHVLHVTLTVAVKTAKGAKRTTRTITLRG